MIICGITCTACLVKVMALFKKLQKRIQQIFNPKTRNEAIKKEYQRLSDDYYNEIKNWLQNRKYPLRSGKLGPSNASRMDQIGGRDRNPTQRTHPGSLSLSEGMLRPKFQNVKNGQEIFFNNSAAHANLFFGKTKAHKIQESGRGLVFWAGTPMPWKPPIDRKKAGPRKYQQVDHPGTMAYNKITQEIFNAHYQKRFQDKLPQIVKRILGV